VCWLFFTFIFFSISRGKLATYILPCFPPLAVLFAVGLERYFKSGKTKSFNNGALILAGILGAGVLVVLSGYFFQFPYGKGEALKLGSGVAGLLVWALLLWCSGREKVSEKKFLFFAVAPLCFMLVSHFSVPGMVLRKKAPGTFFLSQAEKLNDDTVMVAYPSVAAAASWFYKRDDIYILHKGGELEYGLKYPDSGHRLMSFKEFEKFVGKSPGTVLIMEHRDKRDEYVPEGRREASQGELFFIEF
jgi:4-amino-4-deoxy-L-arabinose transferase